MSMEWLIAIGVTLMIVGDAFVLVAAMRAGRGDHGEDETPTSTIDDTHVHDASVNEDPLDPDADENDWCPVCERVTRYDGEVCTVCGREWGYDEAPTTIDERTAR